MSGLEADAATVPSGEQLAEFERAVTAALPEVVGEAATLGAGRVYRSVMARVELPLLRHVLTLAGGNQLKAARMLMQQPEWTSAIIPAQSRTLVTFLLYALGVGLGFLLS